MSNFHMYRYITRD